LARPRSTDEKCLDKELAHDCTLYACTLGASIQLDTSRDFRDESCDRVFPGCTQRYHGSMILNYLSGESTRILPDELGNWLNAELSECQSDVVIHAGHFVLESTGGWLSDHLEDDSPPSPINEFVDFAHFTWNLAVRAIAEHPRSRAQVLTLVNDWQFVRFSLGARRKAELLADEFRNKYYAQTNTLPEFHNRVLHSFGLSDVCVLKADEQRWLFSERRLRDGLAEALGGLLKQNDRRLHIKVTENGEPIVDVVSPAIGEYSLLYCGNTNCAGEVVELLRQLYDRGVRHFVNLFPDTCFGPVTTGTLLANELFDLNGMMVINVSIPLSRQREEERKLATITRNLFRKTEPSPNLA